MVSLPIKEGKAPFKVPSTGDSSSTYYKLIGHISPDVPTVIMLHGGPGAGHEYLLPFTHLWTHYKLPVLFYDQIGCGSSTHFRQYNNDRSFWVEELFTAELDNLIDHLGLRNGAGFHILGQSWGGMLGGSYAGRRPRGLQKLVLASGLASNDLAVKGCELVIEQLPVDVRDVLKEGNRAGELDTPEYKEAFEYLQRHYVCRSEVFPPPELLPALQNMTEDFTVYGSMLGRNFLNITGTLKDWTSIPHLDKIEVPTYVYNGEFDTSHNVAQVPYFELIPRVRWFTVPGAGHMCHIEEKSRELVLNIVGEFLVQTI